MIERLRLEHGGPRFDPHLTLLGGLDGAQDRFAAATELLASSLHVITLRLGGIEFGEQHYRSVYVRVEKNPDLMAARGEALRLFDRQDDPGYMPHLSLLYGRLSPTARTTLAADLGEWCADACQAGRLRLVATGGEPASWRIVRDRVLSFRGC